MGPSAIAPAASKCRPQLLRLLIPSWKCIWTRFHGRCMVLARRNIREASSFCAFLFRSDPTSTFAQQTLMLQHVWHFRWTRVLKALNVAINSPKFSQTCHLRIGKDKCLQRAGSTDASTPCSAGRCRFSGELTSQGEIDWKSPPCCLALVHLLFLFRYVAEIKQGDYPIHWNETFNGDGMMYFSSIFIRH